MCNRKIDDATQINVIFANGQSTLIMAETEQLNGYEIYDAFAFLNLCKYFIILQIQGAIF